MSEVRNPFKGPKSYEEGDVLYGRERETFELINLIESNTLTLFYSKSGIGKTSLINASLITELKKTKKYLPVVFRLGSFINYKTSSRNFSHFLVEEIRNLMKGKFGINIGPQNVPDSLFEMLYLANFEHALEVKDPSDSESTELLIPVIFLDQLEVIFTLDLQEGDLIHFMNELRYLIEGEFPEYLVDFYNPNLSQGSDLEKFLEIQDGIRCAVKRFRIIFSFREEYLFDFENFSNMIPSIRFAASRYRLSPFSRQVATNIIISSSDGMINDAQSDRIINNLLPQNSGNFRQEEIDPFLLSLVCNQLWDQAVTGSIEVTRNIIDNVIDDYISKVYAEISDRAKIFIESYLVTMDNKRTLFSFELAVLWHISAPELKMLIENEEMRLLNKEMYLDSYHVQILHDRLVPPIAARKKEREIGEAERKKVMIQAEQEKALQEKYENQIKLEREKVRKKEEQQKKIQRIYWIMLLVLGLFYTGYMLRESRKEADDREKFMTLTNEGDIKTLEYNRKKGQRVYLDSLGTTLLIAAAIKYDSSLLYYDKNVSTYEKMLGTYGKLVNIDSGYIKSMVNTYQKGLAAGYTLLFPQALAEIKLGRKSRPFDSLVSKLLKIDKQFLTLDDAYYRSRANDLNSFRLDSLSMVYLNSVKVLTEDDFILMSRIKRESSVQILERCLLDFPTACDCMVQLALSYSNEGDDTRATSILEKEFESDGKCKTNASYLLANLYEEQGQDQRVFRIYEYLVSGRDSINYYFLNEFAWKMALKNRRLSFARDLSLKSVKIRPDCSACWDTLAEIYVRMNDFSRAYDASVKSHDLGHERDEKRLEKIESGLGHKVTPLK